MRRKTHFWAGAITGSLILSGCATTKPAKQLHAIQSASQVTTSSQYDSNDSGSSHTTSSTIQPASHQTGANSENVGENASSDVNSPDIGPSNAVVTVAAPVAVQTEEPNATPEHLEQQTAGAPVPINLPTALAMIGGQHPVVGFARWRVQEAYAQLDRAKVMWLPSIQSGFNYRRRDGNYQDVQGSIVDVNLNSFNYGLGAGAVGAGSPSQPGVVARFHLADALFLPKTAEKNAWARGHAASAILNQQLLNGGVAYIDLLEAYQDSEIIAAAVKRTSDLAEITENFAEAGEGLKSDADRTATELSLLQPGS